MNFPAIATIEEEALMPILAEVSLKDVKSTAVLEAYKSVFGDRDPTVERGTVTGVEGRLLDRHRELARDGRAIDERMGRPLDES